MQYALFRYTTFSLHQKSLSQNEQLHMILRYQYGNIMDPKSFMIGLRLGQNKLFKIT